MNKKVTVRKDLTEFFRIIVLVISYLSLQTCSKCPRVASNGGRVASRLWIMLGAAGALHHFGLPECGDLIPSRLFSWWQNSWSFLFFSDIANWNTCVSGHLSILAHLVKENIKINALVKLCAYNLDFYLICFVRRLIVSIVGVSHLDVKCPSKKPVLEA